MLPPHSPNDRQALIGFFDTLAAGRTNFQIGDNTNLFDWTYVDNVSHAHILASDRLETRGCDISQLAHEHLPPVLGEEERPDRPVPTSEERADVTGATDYARSLPSTLSPTSREETLNVRPVVRSKYDQFFHYVHPDIASLGSPLPEAPLGGDYVPVAGEAFFVTNGQPIPFWSFPRALWKEASPAYAAQQSKPWTFSKDTGLTLASLAETYGWLTGKEVTLTKFKVTFTCTTRYYNIEKARRVLGYEPRVGMKEAIKRSAEVSRPSGRRPVMRITACTLVRFLTDAFCPPLTSPCIPPVVAVDPRGSGLPRKGGGAWQRHGQDAVRLRAA